MQFEVLAVCSRVDRSSPAALRDFSQISPAFDSDAGCLRRDALPDLNGRRGAKPSASFFRRTSSAVGPLAIYIGDHPGLFSWPLVVVQVRLRTDIRRGSRRRVLDFRVGQSTAWDRVQGSRSRTLASTTPALLMLTVSPLVNENRTWLGSKFTELTNGWPINTSLAMSVKTRVSFSFSLNRRVMVRQSSRVFSASSNSFLAASTSDCSPISFW